MQDLSITLIQSDIHWHKIDANLAAFEEKIWSTEKSDIILLPEMFNTGFSMDASSMAERMNGKTFKWLRNMASQSGSFVIGSFLVYENSNYYNRLICMEPGGDYSYYDKRHLFRMTGEDKVFSPGNKINIHEIKGWKINTLICYDLRFPVWSRNSYDPDNDSFLYDMIIYVANWPAARISAWDILLKARAVENICFSVGLNRIGTDGVGIDYNGHSNISGPKGDFLEEPREDGFIKRYILSADELTLIRNKFPAHLDFDSYQIKM
jgi:predicted amidohydrolase